MTFAKSWRIQLRRRFPLAYGVASNLTWRWRRDTSQFGEASLLRTHLNTADTYLEIGAYEPHRYSNSWDLARSGWRGWSIDPNPSLRRQWATLRPRDTLISAAVVDDCLGPTYLHIIDGFEGMSFTSEIRDSLRIEGPKTKSVQVPTIGFRELWTLFSQVHGGPPTVLLLDCEGYDQQLLAVLASFDPSQKSTWVLCEELEGAIKLPNIDSYYQLVGSRGVSYLYRLRN